MSKDLIAKLKGMPKGTLLAGLKTANAVRGANVYSYLKFDGRSGRVTVTDGGKEANFPDNTELAFNIMGSQQGYVCWNDGEKQGEYFKSFFEPLPPMETMEDHGPYDDAEKDGWQEQHILMLKDLKTNTQYMLRINSASGRRQVSRLMQTIADQEALHDFTVQTPILTLSAESFTSRGHKNYKPVFDIVRWIDTPSDAAPVSPVDTGARQISSKVTENANSKLESTQIDDAR